MMRQCLGVPEVDAGQEFTFLARGQLLEHFFDVDVCHSIGVTPDRSGCNCNYKTSYHSSDRRC